MGSDVLNLSLMGPELGSSLGVEVMLRVQTLDAGLYSTVSVDAGFWPGMKGAPLQGGVQGF